MKYNTYADDVSDDSSVIIIMASEQFQVSSVSILIGSHFVMQLCFLFYLYYSSS